MTSQYVPPREAFTWIACDADGCRTRTKSASTSHNDDGFNADVAARGWGVVKTSAPHNGSAFPMVPVVYHYCPSHGAEAAASAVRPPWTYAPENLPAARYAGYDV